VQTVFNLTIITVFAPLLGCLIAGLGGKWVGRRGAHWATILLMIISFIGSAIIFKIAVLDKQVLNANLYNWGFSGNFRFDVGFLVDQLTAVMMLTVNFISLLVHIYSVGYMADDPGDQRFICYVSMFTFAMLMLVSANNFFQLYFGWEGVGLVSYLLIGFWYTKESAVTGSLKAFLVNRAGDFGFLLGIAAILDYTGSLDYSTVFGKVNQIANQTISIFPHTPWSIITVICILLFIGAMGKSAQLPLHVWLPESMEGPTPISALIHAATMVTAGVFMVARMSPIFELSPVALNVVLVIGATGALFLGLLAFVEYDIKRVIAYSTMSQLGYMMAANGVSAFPAGMFHLVTHASFKALLFLAAGSVIIAMHHEQDMRKMGNLKKYLPWTCVTFLIGALSLAAIPPFSGFFSKDPIIDAVHLSTMTGASYAYWCLLIGAFVTSYYIFRAYFMTFHTKERMDESVRHHIKETAWTIRGPLVILAIASIVLGFLLVQDFIYTAPGLLGNSVTILPQYDVLHQLQVEFHGVWVTVVRSFHTMAFWFSVAGIFCAWFMVIVAPRIPALLQRYFPFLHYILVKQYGFDAFNNLVFERGTQNLSRFFYRYADVKLIDHYMVDGSGRNVSRISRLIRRMQSGYIYHYAFVMIIGLLVFLFWLLLG